MAEEDSAEKSTDSRRSLLASALGLPSTHISPRFESLQQDDPPDCIKHAYPYSQSCADGSATHASSQSSVKTFVCLLPLDWAWHTMKLANPDCALPPVLPTYTTAASEPSRPRKGSSQSHDSERSQTESTSQSKRPSQDEKSSSPAVFQLPKHLRRSEAGHLLHHTTPVQTVTKHGMCRIKVTMIDKGAATIAGNMSQAQPKSGGGNSMTRTDNVTQHQAAYRSSPLPRSLAHHLHMVNERYHTEIWARVEDVAHGRSNDSPEHGTALDSGDQPQSQSPEGAVFSLATAGGLSRHVALLQQTTRVLKVCDARFSAAATSTKAAANTSASTATTTSTSARNVQPRRKVTHDVGSVTDSSRHSSGDEASESQAARHPLPFQFPFALAETSTHVLVFQAYHPYTLQDAAVLSKGLLCNRASHANALFVLYQLCHQLHALHMRGVAHGAISLNNVFVDDNLRVALSLPVLAPNRTLFNNLQQQQCRPQLPRRTLHPGISAQELDPSRVSLKELVRAWLRGYIGNFQYLMALNRVVGRQMNDPNHHPFLPWITTFEGNSIGDSLRDMTKSKYRLNKGEHQLDFLWNSDPPHHISDVLSELTVYVYLARRLSRSLLCRYVRRKWVPDEYPPSMERMYRFTPDECIPQFYTDGSIFDSIHSDMGDLQIPSYASSPSDFVRQHLELLESDAITASLPSWIDLNFGYLLSGEPAVEAKNVYLHLAKPAAAPSTTGMVQLFWQPHPHRPTSNLWAKMPTFQSAAKHKSHTKSPRLHDSGSGHRASHAPAEPLLISAIDEEPALEGEVAPGSPLPGSDAVADSGSSNQPLSMPPSSVSSAMTSPDRVGKRLSNQSSSASLDYKASFQFQSEQLAGRSTLLEDEELAAKGDQKKSQSQVSMNTQPAAKEGSQGSTKGSSSTGMSRVQMLSSKVAAALTSMQQPQQGTTPAVSAPYNPVAGSDAPVPEGGQRGGGRRRRGKADRTPEASTTASRGSTSEPSPDLVPTLPKAVLGQLNAGYGTATDARAATRFLKRLPAPLPMSSTTQATTIGFPAIDAGKQHSVPSSVRQDAANSFQGLNEYESDVLATVIVGCSLFLPDAPPVRAFGSDPYSQNMGLMRYCVSNSGLLPHSVRQGALRVFHDALLKMKDYSEPIRQMYSDVQSQLTNGISSSSSLSSAGDDDDLQPLSSSHLLNTVSPHAPFNFPPQFGLVLTVLQALCDGELEIVQSDESVASLAAMPADTFELIKPILLTLQEKQYQRAIAEVFIRRGDLDAVTDMILHLLNKPSESLLAMLADAHVLVPSVLQTAGLNAVKTLIPPLTELLTLSHPELSSLALKMVWRCCRAMGPWLCAASVLPYIYDKITVQRFDACAMLVHLLSTRFDEMVARHSVLPFVFKRAKYLAKTMGARTTAVAMINCCKLAFVALHRLDVTAETTRDVGEQLALPALRMCISHRLAATRDQRRMLFTHTVDLILLMARSLEREEILQNLESTIRFMFLCVHKLGQPRQGSDRDMAQASSSPASAPDKGHRRKRSLSESFCIEADVNPDSGRHRRNSVGGNRSQSEAVDAFFHEGDDPGDSAPPSYMSEDEDDDLGSLEASMVSLAHPDDHADVDVEEETLHHGTDPCVWHGLPRRMDTALAQASREVSKRAGLTESLAAEDMADEKLTFLRHVLNDQVASYCYVHFCRLIGANALHSIEPSLSEPEAEGLSQVEDLYESFRSLETMIQSWSRVQDKGTKSSTSTAQRRSLGSLGDDIALEYETVNLRESPVATTWEPSGESSDSLAWQRKWEKAWQRGSRNHLSNNVREPDEVFQNDCVRVFKGHSAAVSTITCCPDERTFVTGSRDRTVRLWSIFSEEDTNWMHHIAVRTPILQFDMARAVTGVAYLPDASMFACDGDVVHFDVTRPERRMVSPSVDSGQRHWSRRIIYRSRSKPCITLTAARGLSYMPEQPGVVMLTADAAIMFDSRCQRPAARWVAPNPGSNVCLTLDPFTGQLVIGQAQGLLARFDARNGCVLACRRQADTDITKVLPLGQGALAVMTSDHRAKILMQEHANYMVTDLTVSDLTGVDGCLGLLGQSNKFRTVDLHADEVANFKLDAFKSSACAVQVFPNNKWWLMGSEAGSMHLFH